MAAILALAAALGWGSSDFAAGTASRRSSAVSVVVLTHLASAVAMAACLVVGWRGHPVAGDVAWGVAAGVSGGLGALFLYRGLARGAMAVVAPITAAGAAAAPALWGLAHGDPFTAGTAVGTGLALAAIVLVSAGAEIPAALRGAVPLAVLEPAGRPGTITPFTILDREARLQRELAVLAAQTRRPTLPPGMADALLSGLGFGGFYVFLSRAGEDAGLWPLVAARGISVLMFAAAALVTTRVFLPAAGTRTSVVWAGLLDAAAAVSFLTATRSGLLSVTAVLSSLYPGVTVVLARVVTKERLTARQVTGLVCAAVAIVAFTLA